MNKVLTIVVPTFNMEKYLNKCLSSCVIDDPNLMSKLEVIVVNDGSVDNSSIIAHSYEANYPNTFIVVDKDNGNYGSCVNVGLKHATGKYIKILDADDWFDKTILKKYLNSIIDIDVDLILNDCCVIENETIGMLYNIASFFEERLVYAFKELFRVPIWRYMAMHCIAYKRDNLLALNYYQDEGISYTDVEWIFSPMTKVETFMAVHGNLYNYLVGRKGQTMDSEIRKKKANELSTMLLSLIRTRDTLEFDDLHGKYLLKIIEAKCHDLYCNASIKQVYEAVIKPFEEEINHKYPIIFKKEMCLWKAPGRPNVSYVPLLHNPWKTVFVKFVKEGLISSRDNLIYALNSYAIRPRLIARVTAKIMISIHE